MRSGILIILLSVHSILIQAQILPGFKSSGSFNEQQLYIENSPPGTRILINAPSAGFKKEKKVLLIFYALPNGNSLEQTFGKRLKESDDWHFNIQQIGAQTRFLRTLIRDQTIVVVYLQAVQKSWSIWMSGTRDSINSIKIIVDDIKKNFAKWEPAVVLNSHSGGGRFIFSYLDAVPEIPEDVVRIAFLDSNYGYEDSLSGPKIVRWLKSGNKKYLCALAYNDSVVIYNGKQLVSPTGGTWYRSKMMKNYLDQSFRFRVKDKDSIIWNLALKRRIEIILRTNPDNLIYHTRQVELNGFIHSILSGTGMEERGYRYFGERAYSRFVSDSVIVPIRRLNIPDRNSDAECGSSFMKRVADLSVAERETEIYKAISSGNIPSFLRNTKTIKDEFEDSAGTFHKVIYEVMSDYLAVGSDSDYCRIPMNPHTAEQLAILFGGSLITSKLSDNIFKMSEIKINPFSYFPSGNSNELVVRFKEHNDQIEKQLKGAGAVKGELVAGIKKDIIISSLIEDRPDKVAIYGWHHPDGKPIQPVYCGHSDQYVDYSLGIRLINNQVLIDGTPFLFTEVLKDPLLFRIFSDEATPVLNICY